MSRGTQITIGILCLMIAATLLLMFRVDVPTGPVMISTYLASFSVAAIIGFSCLLTKGRPYTTRVAAGTICLGLMASVIYLVIFRDCDPRALELMIPALGIGAYAATGYFPRWLPLGQVFGRQERPRMQNASTPTRGKPSLAG
jgi:hypothetical protein